MRKYRITKVTTKFGDEGWTLIVGGDIVSKDHPRVSAYGTIDELSSFLSLAIEECKNKENKNKGNKEKNNLGEIIKILEKIQKDLFIVSSDLSVPQKIQSKRVPEELISWLEEKQNELMKNLEPLKEFIIPGGTKISALIHIARTITRRAEREIVKLSKKEKINPLIIKYINRLSDLLFVLARYSNKILGAEDKYYE